MKYIFFIIIALICSISFGQDEFCKPKNTERIAKKLIKKLSKEDLKSVTKISKDSAVDNQLFMVHKRNTNELKHIRKYLITKGCNYFLVDNLEEVILEYTYYKINKIDTCMSDLLQPYIDNNFARIERFKRNAKADSIDGNYIPKNLDECFVQINSFWNDSLKLEVKKMTEKDFSANSHFGFGMWMRNNWGLWGGSRLATYFNNFGIYHADDMSGIILTSFHRHLTGKEILLENQVNYYKNYWIVNKVPLKDEYPKGVKKIEFNTSKIYNLKKNGQPGCVHIQTNSKSNKTWIYDSNFGWKQLTKTQLARLRNTNLETRENILIELFK